MAKDRSDYGGIDLDRDGGSADGSRVFLGTNEIPLGARGVARVQDAKPGSESNHEVFSRSRE